MNKYFKLSVKDIMVTVCSEEMSVAACFIFCWFGKSEHFVPVIAVLAVFFVSLITDGYLYGIFASLVSMIQIDYFFIQPYKAIDFENPICLSATFIVAILICILTKQLKERNIYKLEVEKERMISNLLRSISHDIRTPLTAITGASTLLLENQKMLSEDTRNRLLKNISDEAQWLIRIAENVLSITKIGGDGSAQIRMTPESVEEIVAEAIAKIRKRFPEAVINVEVPEEPLIVPMDAMLIEQALINLIENSLIHAKSATYVKLSVKKKGRNVFFEVIDDGVGFEKSAFFENPDNYDSDDSEAYTLKRNMGIGLSVCRAIIKAHGGDFGVINKKSSGVVFWFCLNEDENISDVSGYDLTWLQEAR